MALCTLPFYNDGKPFEPTIWPEDVADYDQQELPHVAVLRQTTPATAEYRTAKAAIVQLQAAFVLKVLRQTEPSRPVPERLTASQVNGAWVRLYQSAHVGWTEQEVVAPLGRAGASSPLLPSQG